MVTIIRRDWRTTVEVGAVCVALALLGAIVAGLF